MFDIFRFLKICRFGFFGVVWVGSECDVEMRVLWRRGEVGVRVEER